jgi:hypothetical protein
LEWLPKLSKREGFMLIVSPRAFLQHNPGNRGKVNLDALFWNNTHILGNRVGSKGDLLEALRFCTSGQLRPSWILPIPWSKRRRHTSAWRRESNLAKSCSCRKESTCSALRYAARCKLAPFYGGIFIIACLL